MKILLRFLREEDGPTAVEYAVMLAMILMAAFVAVTSLGTSTSSLWGNINTQTQAQGLGS
ncbi:MAG: Flp family type IVb pilin [Pirellulales bacterium]